ncbi:MAG: NAD(P)/FAD-dependent oxidoreductase [Dehalococcoidales bacterium]|nr:NAD(P)/FAD-dependent oxidoreductase [Dehalococcoidales bacterium]
MAHRVDITIIGAGVVGLAIASAVAKRSREVYLLEKNEKFGQEQSSRNSEVIHAGIYYDRSSLKVRLCLEGNNLLYELCEKKGIACRKCGKIIVATNEIESRELEKLYSRGRDNGVPLQMLSAKEMRRFEPNLKGVAAFFSPTTGIVDSYALMNYFLAGARENGVQVVYKTEVNGIEKQSGGYQISVNDPSGDFSFMSKVLINCAGLHSDKVAEMAGINLEEAGYRLHWCKGEYYSVSGGKNKLLNRLVYPVPTDISVGVHVCFDVDWRLRLGPHFYYVDELSYKVDDSRKYAFLESSMMKALPFIGPSDLAPETSGILAMLQGSGEGQRDFVIEHEYKRGLPGFVNLVGIESPGLTSSPAIAGYVSRLVDEILGS